MPRKTVQNTQASTAIRSGTKAYTQTLLAGVTQTFQAKERVLSARPDPIDFRDLMFEPTLVEVPPRIPLEHYLAHQIPILDQGREGACTGFALATVANFLLWRRAVDPDPNPVSPRMLYELARRYDEFPGEAYVGSTARGAMKGWHKHGVCAEADWPYLPQRPGQLTEKRAEAAAQRPLGAYYRVNHKDLVAMHSAIAEVGILYVSAQVHSGWQAVDQTGEIHYAANSMVIGGHAFAIVAYDEDGFWIQNSWGKRWGKNGFAHLTYDDWLDNGSDVWVARLGAPVRLASRQAIAPQQYTTAKAIATIPLRDLRPHVLLLDNDGQLKTNGSYGMTEADLALMFQETFPRLTQGWSKKRIMLYAHGGLVSEQNAIDWTIQQRERFLKAEIYPICFVWRSDTVNTVKNILQDAFTQRSSGTAFDQTKNFMLDRLDDALEPLTRILGGKALWDEMKENASRATTDSQGGARILLKYLNDPAIELHLAGHSAGAVLLAPLAQYIGTVGKIAAGPLKGKVGLGLPVASCALWAPACTTALFKQTYLPILQSGVVKRFTLFTLTDQYEQDDNCADIYHKSLLYLVSNAFEAQRRIPLIHENGEPLLGMEKFVEADNELKNLFTTPQFVWIRTPNTDSGARTHTAFDNDPLTLDSTVKKMQAQS